MSARFTDAVILGRRNLTARISEFTLGLADGTALPPARAGSHVELRFGGESGRFLRHYSLVGPLTARTAQEGFWRIAVQREDRRRGSDYIHRHLRPGSRLQISGEMSPFRMAQVGGMAQTEGMTQAGDSVLLVAGGIGITAMLPMLRSCVMRQVPVRMLYAGRSRAEMAFADEVKAMGGDRVTLHDQAALGRRPDLAALLAAQPPGTTAYVCGPPGLIAALGDEARRQGWPPERLRHEIFNAAHRPDDAELTVRTASGREVRVGAGTTILDALEMAGVDTLSDCRRGECGLCVTRLKRAAPIDHRDRYLTTQERAAMDQIAICCSRPKDRLIELDI